MRVTQGAAGGDGSHGEIGTRGRAIEPDGRKVTLRDVAEASGVSVGAVSMALNRKDGVSESTRRRILDAARALGYERSQTRESRTGSIVNIIIERLPVSPTSDPFNKPILLGLQTAARRAGFRVALEFVGPDEEPQAERWIRDSTAGIVLLGGGDLGPDWVRAASVSDVPVVMVDHFVPDLALPAIVADNVGGAYSATRHLLEMGHERVGFIRGPSKYWTLSERMAGYLLATQQAGLPVDPQLIPPRVSHGEEKGYGEMRHLLALPDPPTAVFAVSDKTAIGGYRAVREAGLSVPGDVSVVGFDNIGEAHSLDPPLTTVDVSGENMGLVAFHRLLALMSDGEMGEASPLKWTIPTKLVVRGSVRELSR
jgi:LacI family transcriptional regulator